MWLCRSAKKTSSGFSSFTSMAALARFSDVTTVSFSGPLGAIVVSSRAVHSLAPSTRCIGSQGGPPRPTRAKVGIWPPSGGVILIRTSTAPLNSWPADGSSISTLDAGGR